MKEPKLFVAGKAFIEDNSGKILVLKESSQYKDATNIGKYDVVGGRLVPGENFFEAMKREIKEETNLEVEIIRPFAVNEWSPVVRDEQWQIIGIFFKCKISGGEIRLSEDHEDYKWINPKEYKNEGIIDNIHKMFESYLNLNQN